MNYWLMKSEPDVFGIDDLAKSPRKTTHWDGVRNFQARNFMQQMKVGDQVIIYHSSAEPPGAAGIAEVAREAEPAFYSIETNDIISFLRDLYLAKLPTFCLLLRKNRAS